MSSTTNAITVPIGLLDGDGNIRTVVDKKAQEILNASVKETGILLPIVIRQINTAATPYHILDGRRRYLAAKAAGLKEVPILLIAGPKTEEEFQLVVNTVRSNLHPLDEARVAEQILKSLPGDAGLKEVGAVLGQSIATVRRRLQLTKLTPKGQELLRAGKMALSVAEAMAPYPAETQDRTIGQNRSDLMDIHSIDNHLNQGRTPLSSAPWSWKDAELVKAAGACTTCPKKTLTGTIDLFDGAKADECLDDACFLSKLKSHFRRAVDQVKAQHPKEKVVGINRIGYYPQTQMIDGIKALGQGEYQEIPSANIKKLNRQSIGVVFDSEHPDRTGKTMKVALKGDYVPTSHRAMPPTEKKERKEKKVRKQRYGILLKELVINPKAITNEKGAVQYLADEEIKSLQHFGAQAAVQVMGLEAKKEQYGGRDHAGAVRKELEARKVTGIRQLIIGLLIGTYYQYENWNVRAFCKVGGIKLPKEEKAAKPVKWAAKKKSA